MIKTDPLAFAAAVVASSKPDLSVGEKLELYIQAAELATKRNKDQVSEKSIGFFNSDDKN